jgi:hypothetical protein
MTGTEFGYDLKALCASGFNLKGLITGEFLAEG